MGAGGADDEESVFGGGWVFQPEVGALDGPLFQPEDYVHVLVIKRENE
jgi:hypothetical protein